MSLGVSCPEGARVGDIVGGKYRLLRLLGQGGMGAVYEAENTWTKRRVATKLLRPEYAADEQSLRRFQIEAQSASQIAHPHIIDIFDLGQGDDGSLFMVQELLVGVDLGRHLAARGKLPVDEALSILVPILSALVCAHDRGVVHRDIKPENIFLCSGPGAADVTPKLIDFGISKVLGQDGGIRTHAGALIGTPRYMSPEQISGDEAVDGRADLWSIAVVLHEVLTGKNPFAAPSSFLSINKVLSEAVPRLDEVDGDLPRALGDCVETALRRDPGERFPDMRAFLAAVLASGAAPAAVVAQHSAALLPARARPEAAGGEKREVQVSLRLPPSAPTQATRPGAAAKEDPLGPAVEPAQRPRRPVVAALIVSVALSALAAGTWALWPATIVPPPAPPPATAVSAPPEGPAPASVAASPPAPAIRPPAPRPLLRPARPPQHREHGANQAPIVE